MSDFKDLYEFPSDYIGRKSFVSVRGHVRSVPKYKTYLGTDSRNHILPAYGGEEDTGQSSAYYMPDKSPYQSPMDGSYITSRSTHQEHMRRHGVMEAGDMPMPTKQRDRDVHRAVSGRDVADAIRRLGGH